MDTEFSITVTIADRNYKLKTPRSEEEIIRKAAKLIEDLSKKYSNQYGYKDKQDLLAIIVLENVTTLLKLQEQEKFKNEDLENKLMELNVLLSDCLSEK